MAGFWSEGSVSAFPHLFPRSLGDQQPAITVKTGWQAPGSQEQSWNASELHPQRTPLPHQAGGYGDFTDRAALSDLTQCPPS